jgi:hypothetical protein
VNQLGNLIWLAQVKLFAADGNQVAACRNNPLALSAKLAILTSQ